MNIYNLVGCLPRNKPNATRKLSNINTIVIHHTAGSPHQSPQQIAEYHTQHNKWRSIGYHCLIDYKGNIFKTLNDSSVGIHALNYNTISLGISVIGNYRTIEPSSLAIEALNHMVKTFLLAYPNIKYVVGHRDRRATECPGEALYKYIKKQGWYNNE